MRRLVALQALLVAAPVAALGQAASTVQTSGRLSNASTRQTSRASASRFSLTFASPKPFALSQDEGGYGRGSRRSSVYHWWKR